MKPLFLILLLCVLQVNLFAQKQYKYPIAPKDSMANEYFGNSIMDPYQWMENPEDERLTAWVDEQKEITEKVRRQQLHTWTLQRQLSAMYHQVKTDKMKTFVEPEKVRKSKYQFRHQTKNYSRSSDLMYKKRSSSNYFTLLNVKDYQHNKKENIAINKPIVDKGEKRAVVLISRNGSDWREAYFFDLETGKAIGDTLKCLRGGSRIVWNDRGIFYDRFDEPNPGKELLDKATGQRICYHKMGDPQDADKVVYANPDTSGTDYYRYSRLNDTLLLMNRTIHRGAKTYRTLAYANYRNTEALFFKDFLVYPNSSEFYIDAQQVINDKVILKTNWDSPNGRVLVAELNGLNKLTELVPEFDVSLKQVNRLGKDKLACIYRNSGKSTVLLYSLKGELIKRLDFPEGKKIEHFYENDTAASYMEFCISSFYHPNLWYQLSLSDYTYKPIQGVSVPYDASKLETRYVKYPSKDGTLIPMYITCLKTTKLNGKNPTLLYAYGGYGKVVEPHFNQSQVLWLLHGGVLAIPNVRGGGVEGSDWSEEGKRLKKQNTIDDFTGAAQYLIDEKYSTPQKLVAKGGSHGGLLVAAAAIQKPELFKAVVAEAGVYDMLRFNKFTVGSAGGNINEFGIPSDSSDFFNLWSYSPLHNVKKGVVYPNFLLVTGDSDDRVPPLHSYKFLATMQDKGSSKSLYQLYLIPGAGHGGALNTTDFTEKVTFLYYYLFDQTGLEFWKSADGSLF